jgi:hypothetical protein
MPSSITQNLSINEASITRADGEPVNLRGMYAGRSCFLLCGGPSLGKLTARQRRMLSRPGMVTVGLNNSPRVFRPQIWFCVDDADHFIRSIFLDPRIMKFLPRGKAGKAVFNSDAWKPMGVTVGECPSTFFFELTHDGYPDQFLSQRQFFWGFSGDDGGGRSVMHIAPKLLHWLGFSRVYLVGADFRMSPEEKYAFEQDRAKGSISNNNSTYAKLNDRFDRLRPTLEAAGLTIINCTPGSDLKSFEFMGLTDAINAAWREFDVNVGKERTYGLYERAGLEKAVGKWLEKADARAKDAAPLVTEAIEKPKDKRAVKAAKRAIEKAINAVRTSFEKERDVIKMQLWKAT